MSLVYHMAPRDFIGEVLYSLNALKTHLPEIYETQAQRYAGSEVLRAPRLIEFSEVFSLK